MRNLKFLFVLLSVLALALPVAAQDEGVTFVGDTSNSTKMQQLLEFMIGGYGPLDPDVTVYIGGLPENMNFDLPLTGSAEIIGSIERGQGYGPPGMEMTEIFLASDSSPRTLLDEVTTMLAEAGWEQSDEARPSGGFQADQNVFAAFCLNEGDASLNFEAFTRSDTVTVVLRTLEPGEPYLCGENPRGDFYDVAYRLMPTLETPDGIETTMQRGGGGITFDNFTRNASTSILIISEESAATLLNLYNEQLMDAGWELVSAEDGDTMAISTWAFEGEGVEWGGILTFIQNPAAANEYMGLLSIQEKSAE